MAQLTIVVAIDAQRGIGINNTLPWHLPEDLAHFKRTTTGHPIIMGRKTFDSIGRPLPNRRNIVVTRNQDWRHDGVEAVTSLAAAIALVHDVSSCIIGGAQIFRLPTSWSSPRSRRPLTATRFSRRSIRRSGRKSRASRIIRMPADSITLTSPIKETDEQ
jgi:hypothetical protein